MINDLLALLFMGLVEAGRLIMGQKHSKVTQNFRNGSSCKVAKEPRKKSNQPTTYSFFIGNLHQKIARRRL